MKIDLNNNKKKEENNFISSGSSFFKWIQEFSKKIVTISSIIFVVSNIFILALMFMNYINSNDLSYMDTFIMETNQTFREVIGGYIIKAAAENAIKIAGSIIDKHFNNKSNEDDVENSSSNESDIEY